MADVEQLKLLRKGIEVWNSWRGKNPGISIDLREANLTGADLTGANLREADLGGANLREANLGGARLSATSFADVDLSSALHLNDVKFSGPCLINNETLIKSPGLPVSFLRGCGLSDWEIESAKLFNPKLSPNEVVDIIYNIEKLRNESPIQIHNLFISYSHKDSDFVDFLEEFLNKRNIRFWRDVHDATAGPLEAQIFSAIDKNGTVLLILSEHSIESDWVEAEIEKARQLEKTSDRPLLCPIALDDSWKNCKWEKRLMSQIKKYNILDFSGWETNTNFEKDFEKLAKGLDLFYRVKVAAKIKDVVQVKNPKSGKYVKIDRSTGRIMSHKKSAGPYKGVPFVRISKK